MALYTKAAEAGHLRSQGNLAMLYQASGEWEKAYVWLRIAEMGGGGAQARPVIEQAKKHMSQGQIDSSEVKVSEWQKAHTKKPYIRFWTVSQQAGIKAASTATRQTLWAQASGFGIH